MKNTLTKWMLVSLVTACVSVYYGPRSCFAEIKFGILPRLSAVELYSMFSPLAEYLTRETGEKVSIVIPRNFDAFKAAVNAGQIDIGFANSLIYVQLKREVELVPLAVAAELKAGIKFRGIIIARKDSGIENIGYLRGKKMIFVEKDSAGGHIFQMFLLSKVGLDAHRDFIILPFAKKHDNVVMAVYNRAADAGGLREDDLALMKDKVDLSQLKIVGFTDYYPNWPLFATSRLGKDSAEKIQAALLKLKPHAANSVRILGRARLTGFAPVQDKDYDQLRRAAKLAGAL